MSEGQTDAGPETWHVPWQFKYERRQIIVHRNIDAKKINWGQIPIKSQDTDSEINWGQIKENPKPLIHNVFYWPPNLGQSWGVNRGRPGLDF